ncbi:putative membrane protein [Oopsacas minuta]|uniref:Membrane protein n=1 Tax=Oopsacas minuta TaxID=111878 RepID=A0AAV7JNB1_9METZ|nr:putative membrane protein [Oopsacas minuta]
MTSIGDRLCLTPLRKVLSTSLPIKLLCVTILILYFLANFREFSLYLICFPYYIKPPALRLWTLVTASFVETRIILASVDIFSLLSSATILEPIWGVPEFFIFLTIISVIPVSLIISFLFIIGFLGVENFAYKLDVYGAAGILCGLTVALKQVHPDYELSLIPPISFRFKHLPSLCLSLHLLLGGFDMIEPMSIILSITGLLVSWIYLRFFQHRESDMRGDPTDTFEFVTLFPETLHPCLNKFGATIATCLRAIRLYPAAHRTYDLGNPSDIEMLLPQTGTTSTDRRKLKAQKDLEERLSRTVEKSEEEWPDLLAADTRDGELESVVVTGENETIQVTK